MPRCAPTSLFSAHMYISALCTLCFATLGTFCQRSAPDVLRFFLDWIGTRENRLGSFATEIARRVDPRDTCRKSATPMSTTDSSPVTARTRRGQDSTQC